MGIGSLSGIATPVTSEVTFCQFKVRENPSGITAFCSAHLGAAGGVAIVAMGIAKTRVERELS
ncbi:MAG: hypothetical protein DDT19_01167 [Syntrophomonadaceae bacterium]|nr:hypothetical protein [Bacillota bacterium]